MARLCVLTLKNLGFFVILRLMQKLSESQRVSEIEQKWQGNIEKLFYNWHWNDGLTHKEIANKIDLPRPTITRWFRQLNVPTQDCERPTKKRYQIRLLKILKQIRKRKIHYEKPCLANKHFFKNWSPEMAYVLGYFAADGCMFINPRGSHFIEFTSTDRELIEKVKKCLDSKHLLSVLDRSKKNDHWKTRFRIQIGSKEMFNDLLKLGFVPNKSNQLQFPALPDNFLSDFVRGYFDGDGCVHHGFYKRKNRPTLQFVFSTNFVSGSRKFLEELHFKLQMLAGIEGGFMTNKQRGFQLTFAGNDSERLYKFMYDNPKNLFLTRKYNKFQEAFKIMRV